MRFTSFVGIQKNTHIATLFLASLLAVGCVSSKTAFQDYSTLGATPFEYVKTSVVASHLTQKPLCLFESNSFRGAGSLYQKLHKKYRLSANEAFVNQRYDVVKKFALFYCETEYFLWADIVHFDHAPAPIGPVSKLPNVKPATAPAPKIPSPESKPDTVIFQSDVGLTVSCIGQSEITGRPSQSAAATKVEFQLNRSSQRCFVNIGTTQQVVTVTPGTVILCVEKRTPEPCFKNK
jgi:hypothetical protein